MESSEFAASYNHNLLGLFDIACEPRNAFQYGPLDGRSTIASASFPPDLINVQRDSHLVTFVAVIAGDG
jgi:hypothetical protein